MANSNTSSQRVVEESSSNANDANNLPDSSSPNAFINEVCEVAFFQEFISAPGPTEEEVTKGDISALLKQLDAADGVAQGVESKLDKLLENLEGLLDGLEGVQEVQPEGRRGENGLGRVELNLDTHEDIR